VDDRTAIALVVMFLVSLVYLGTLLVLLRPRVPLPARLVGLGALLALTAAWFALVTGAPSRSVPAQFQNTELAEGLLKLATVLVLGGIVTGLWPRDASPRLPTTPEEPGHVPPSA
jgi:heme A synthase